MLLTFAVIQTWDDGLLLRNLFMQSCVFLSFSVFHKNCCTGFLLNWASLNMVSWSTVANCINLDSLPNRGVYQKHKCILLSAQYFCLILFIFKNNNNNEVLRCKTLENCFNAAQMDLCKEKYIPNPTAQLNFVLDVYNLAFLLSW